MGTRARPFSSKALPRAVAEALPARQEKAEGAGGAGDAADGTSVLLDAAAAYGAVELLRRLGILVDEYPVARLGDRFPDASSFPRRTHVIDLLGSQDLVAALSRALVGLQPGINVDIVLVDDYKARACRRALDEAGARGDAVAFGALVDNRLFVGPFAPAGSGVLDDLIFALRFNDRAAQIGGSVLRSPLPLDRIRKTATPFALTMREQLDEWFTRGHCRAEEAIIELVEIGSGRRVPPIRRQPHSQDVAPATEAIPLDLRTRGTDAIGRSVSTADFLERNAHLLSDVTGVVQLPEGKEMVMPGDNVEMEVELITPIAIEQGLRFAIREGGRTVGSGRVVKIIE